MEDFKVGDVVKIDLEKVFKYTDGKMPLWYSSECFIIYSILPYDMAILNKELPFANHSTICTMYLSLDIKTIRKEKLDKLYNYED